ncbi:MAG: TonB-dependent receptor [Bacteroidia bacterium]
MKKLLFLFLILNELNALGQTNTMVSIYDLSDSSKLEGAKIEINFLSRNFKSITAITDETGVATIALQTNTSFNLLISKDGYKPIFTTLANAPLKLDIFLKPLVYDGEEVTVTATRTGILNTATFTQVTKKEIAARNFGQDLPILLQGTPSTVTTSDAGAGIGYTGIRIRGIDPTRINVTVNGVPLNDAESQGVFWVNMPDFSSGVENIQVQRGVGTSTNGAGAFGASINIKTDKFSETPFTKISASMGSFNTNRQSVKLGTGRMKNNWYAEGRMSWIHSDGYIDRAASDLQAWSFSTGHKTAKSLFQVVVFSGSEKTYQAWNGVPMVKFYNDSSEVDSLINFLWYDSTRSAQLRQGDPNKYNYYTYKNESDNYKQSHFQVVYNRSLRKNQTFNVVLHGTLGKGYYENFETKTNLANYMDTPVVFYGIHRYQANLIRQRWLDNNFAGVVFSYNKNGVRTDQTIGGAVNVYNGNHFGKVIWHEFMDMEKGTFNYYDNDSRKTDANMYWKVQHKFTKELSAFTDMQVRQVGYSWFGPSSTGAFYIPPGHQSTSYFFFNPKAGIQFQPKSNQFMYLTYGRASREPVRDDFINSSAGNQPKPEFMNNVEAAFKSNYRDWKYTFTGYYMGYKNQLALSGKINDVGGYSRINIPKSYRAGLEIEASVDIATWINWGFNITISQNKIEKFTEYVDDWTNGGQKTYEWENTDLALSPNRIIGSQFTVKATKDLTVLFLNKYVSRQFLDNTQTESRSLEPYLINDMILQYNLPFKGFKNCNIALMINNIGNQAYSSNGYSYSGIINNSRKDFNFVYPQAGTNFLARVEMVF